MQLVFDDKTGTFTENTPPALNLQPGAGCRHVAFHPNRRYVYLLNELDGTLVVYRLDQSAGTLSEISRDTILRDDLEGTPWGAQIHVSPDGKRLYASERRGSTLAAWKIDSSSGQLSDRRIIETGTNPRCFDVTANGKFIVLSAMGDNQVTLYDVSDHEADPKAVLSLPTGAQPGWVEIV